MYSGNPAASSVSLILSNATPKATVRAREASSLLRTAGDSHVSHLRYPAPQLKRPVKRVFSSATRLTVCRARPHGRCGTYNEVADAEELAQVLTDLPNTITELDVQDMLPPCGTSATYEDTVETTAHLADAIIDMLPNLRSLDLPIEIPLGLRTAERLLQLLTNLQHLRLHLCRGGPLTAGPGFLFSPTQLPERLRSLHLAALQRTAGIDIAALAGAHSLRHLSLQHFFFRTHQEAAVQWAAIAQLTQLHSLEVQGLGLGASALVPLAALSSLTCLKMKDLEVVAQAQQEQQGEQQEQQPLQQEQQDAGVQEQKQTQSQATSSWGSSGADAPATWQQLVALQSLQHLELWALQVPAVSNSSTTISTSSTVTTSSSNAAGRTSSSAARSTSPSIAPLQHLTALVTSRLSPSPPPAPHQQQAGQQYSTAANSSAPASPSSSPRTHTTTSQQEHPHHKQQQQERQEQEQGTQPGRLSSMMPGLKHLVVASFSSPQHLAELLSGHMAVSSLHATCSPSGLPSQLLPGLPALERLRLVLNTCDSDGSVVQQLRECVGLEEVEVVVQPRFLERCAGKVKVQVEGCVRAVVGPGAACTGSGSVRRVVVRDVWGEGGLEWQEVAGIVRGVSGGVQEVQVPVRGQGLVRGEVEAAVGGMGWGVEWGVQGEQGQVDCLLNRSA